MFLKLLFLTFIGPFYFVMVELASKTMADQVAQRIEEVKSTTQTAIQSTGLQVSISVTATVMESGAPSAASSGTPTPASPFSPMHPSSASSAPDLPKPEAPARDKEDTIAEQLDPTIGVVIGAAGM